jgi:hypothetical protein
LKIEKETKANTKIQKDRQKTEPKNKKKPPPSKTDGGPWYKKAEPNSHRN